MSCTIVTPTYILCIPSFSCTIVTPTYILCIPSFSGIVDLKNCSKVTNRENMRGFKHVFDVVTQERKYHLVADNELEKRSWIDILNTTLFTHSHTHTSSQDTKQQQRQVKDDDD